MKITNISGFKNVNHYIDYKIGLLEKSDKTMKSLFYLMFSEHNNIFFEESDGLIIKKMTYGEAFRLVITKSADLYHKINEKSGAVVGIYMENSPHWIIAFWSIIRAGYCPILLNTRFDENTIESIIKIMDVKAIISDAKTFSVKTIMYDEIEESKEELNDVEFGNELYFLSSGTNSVKICTFSSKELIEIIYNSNYVLKKNKRIKKHYQGELKLLTVLPFYHIFGFVAVYLWFGFFSRTFVTLNDLKPMTVKRTIQRHHVTHIFAVPLFWSTVYNQAIKTIQKRGEKTYLRFLKGMKLSDKLGNSFLGKWFSKKCFKEVRNQMFGDSVQFMITGGSCIDNEVLRFFNGIGYYLVNGYGMSEIGITSVELSEKRKRIVNGSIGLPFPSVEYKIDRGVLYVKGSSVAKAIIINDKRIELNGTWYKTCDLVSFKKHYFSLLGREDDLIVSATGENLNPVQIENYFAFHECKGVCLLNGRNHDLPFLLVSIDKGTSPETVEKILESIKRKMIEQNLLMQIGKIVFTTDDLIIGNEFKLNRKRLVNDYYSGKLTLFEHSSKESSVHVDELTQKIKEYFAFSLNKSVDEIDINTNFFLDEGGTSLEYFALIAKLQEEFSIDFPTEMGNGLNTVKEIVDYLHKKL